MLKNVTILSIGILTAGFTLTSCDSDSDQKIENELKSEVTVVASGSEPAQSQKEEEISAVCVWDKLSVRAEAGGDGKWLTSLNSGEKVTFLNEKQSGKEGGKDREYIKVRLLDGKEGWVREDLVIVDGKGGVITRDADIYSRPDLLTKTNRNFAQFDIIAVKSDKDGWMEVVGKRKDGTWIEEGYIKPGAVSFKDVDIAVAKFASIALANKDKNKKIAAIREITDNADLRESTFRNQLLSTLDELEMDYDSIGLEADEDLDF
ncbi:MAG: SH3 domain-containing protein [Cytophagaceae bacterium]